MTKHEAGTFSFTDLATTDVEAARAFYAALFGWTYVDLPMPDGSAYTMAKVGDRDAAAMSLQRADEKQMGIPPHWNAYLTVDDVDRATERATQAGGKVLAPPFDVMDAGRMAVIADPTGAAACLWTAKGHIGSHVVDEHGAIAWADVVTTDEARSGAFWKEVFGWTGARDANGYTVFSANGRAAAGMLEMKDMPPCWMVYFAVDDCDAAVKRATELGGKVFKEVTDVPGVGRFAVLADPQGAGFCVLQQKRY